MPPRKTQKKAKALEIPGSPSYPGKKDGKGLDAPQWEACRRMIEGVYNTTEDGLYIAEIFCKFPDREDYADYYESIPEPECLDNVATLLSDQAFLTPDKFFAQLLLIFLNAKHYNEEGSQLWDDANDFEEQIWGEWKKYAAEGLFKEKPQLPKTQAKRARKGKAGSADPSTSATPAPASTTPALPSVPELPKPILVVPPAARVIKPAPVIPQTPNHPPPKGLSQADQQVVAKVDEKLPRWSGPQAVIAGPSSGAQGSGWWEGGGDINTQIKSVIAAISDYRDTTSLRLAETLERVPPSVDIQYLSFNGIISLESIRQKADQSEYKSFGEYDLDMARLFERGRRWFLEGTKEYGHILTLQRYHHALTSIQAVGPVPSPTHFASIPAGPGRARPQSEAEGPLGITSQKVILKDRTFISEARYKGQTFKVGDFIHLANPDDPSRPIIAQIFKTFIPNKTRTNNLWITACWYFRPEQTVHTADRQFMEREVMKTGHFCDHPGEDIIEKVSLQFYVKYVRGRPRPGEYYPGWPLYVCQSRFNDKIWASIRIKNWASCIPEELRQSDFMSLIPFERVIEPLLFPSPFHAGSKGPGFIAEPRGSVDEEDEERPAVAKVVPPALAPKPMPVVPPTPPTYRSTPAPVPQVAPLPPASTKTFGAMYGGQQAMDQIAQKEHLPLETARLFDRDARQTVLWFSGPPLPSTQESQRPVHSLAYLSYLAKRKAE